MALLKLPFYSQGKGRPIGGTSLYARILATSPTVFNPLDDASSPMVDVAGSGVTVTNFTVTGSVAYQQPGIEAGHTSVKYLQNARGMFNVSAYDAVLTPLKFSVMRWMKFIPPFLDGTTVRNVGYEFYTSYQDWLYITKFNVANTIQWSYYGKEDSNVKTILMQNIDYNWHCYVFTLDKNKNRVRAYLDGNLVVELGTFSEFSGDPLESSQLTGFNSASIVDAYFQYHAYWSNKELTQDEVIRISIP